MEAEKLQRQITELERNVMQLAARLEALHGHMRVADWYFFLVEHPEAEEWFNPDGSASIKGVSYG